MLDDSSREIPFQFDGHFNKFVEVISTDIENLQDPGEGPKTEREHKVRAAGLYHREYDRPIHYNSFTFTGIKLKSSQK